MRRARSGTPERLGREPGFPRLLGGHLCLDFANSVDARNSDRPQEFLTHPLALAAWGFHVGLVAEPERHKLEAAIAGSDSGGALVLSRALRVREATYRVVAAAATAAEPSSDDLAMLRAEYVEALTRGRLVRTGAGFTWTWCGLLHPECVTDACLYATIELLVSSDIERVRVCPGCGDCGWLFLDTSRNRSRQWCSMEGCGSRAKMRRLYRRRKAAE